MVRELRRIITGHNEEGKSIVAYDGAPMFGMNWITNGSPADNKHKNDTAMQKPRLEPPSNGTKFSYFQLEPEDPSMSAEDLEKGYADVFAAGEASHCRVDTSRHPGMHKTKTIDYIILLEGEVTLLLEEDEVELKPFDVVIQRGTNHAWVNKGSKTALLAAVLIDAEPI
ncbi:MAG: cupin domain-containing protein [Promethearchaeota archaeon]|jgi:hypothetical protein